MDAVSRLRVASPPARFIVRVLTTAGTVDIDAQTVTLSQVREVLSRERGGEACRRGRRGGEGAGGAPVWVKNCWRRGH